jgi:hypothetical protein
MSTNPYAPPQARVDDVESRAKDTAPPLWNPNAAAMWSLLFSPVFGAWLHMKNWQALGEPEKASASKTWLIMSAALLLLVVIGGMFLPETKAIDSASRAAGIGLLVAWYTVSGREQIRYVTGRYGKTYPRKGWGAALGYGVLGLFAFFVVIFLVAFAMAAATGDV